MTNSSVAPAQRSSAAVSLRKTNKPLMEKRRRARINDSLSQLKSLVIQSSKKDSSQFNKLEKADILELTVKHLRTLQTRDQQQQQLMAGPATAVDSAGKYCTGFMECANEVLRFLKQSQDFSDDTKARVMGHLAGCLQFSSQASSSSYAPKASSQIHPEQSLSSMSGPAPAPVLASATLMGPASSQQSSSTPAQLSSGQIIHIVNTSAPFQQAQVVPTASSTKPVASLGQSNTTSCQPLQIAPSALPPKQTVVAPQHYPHPQTPKQQSPMSSSSPIKSCVAPVPPASLQDKAYMRFSQPLHIQIPNSHISPYIINKSSNTSQAETIRPSTTSEELPLALPVALKPQYPSSLSTSPSDTLPSTTSPSPLPADLAPPQKSKHVHFYSEDVPVFRDNFIPRHRSYSLTSSSSSESEMSPLNLSQSPDCPVSQRDPTYLSECFPGHYSHSKSISPVSPSHNYLLLQPQHHHSSQEIKDHQARNHFTSVIVNRKQQLDVNMMASVKYMGMELEDERLMCPRQHGTPSPASSMGEERVWRPW